MIVIVQRYELQRELGSGGMGTVYEALDRQSEQTVAIKALKAEIAQRENIERFKREGAALRDLNHPNIVKMLDEVEQHGQHYLIMEYVRGGDLKALIEQNGIPHHQCVNIAIDIADALTRAHRLNIIHRDLKPANVLLSNDGTLRLTDFGVAYFSEKERVTDSNALVGTIDYLPPEAFSGGEYDERGDIWAFGVMLFEMLTGTRPFTGDTLAAVIQAIMTEPVPDLEQLCPEAPIALIDLVYRMLERDPQVRISSVRHVGAALEDVLYQRDGTPTPSVRPPRFDTPATINAGDFIRHNLPEQVSPFVGREHELGEVQRLLQRSDVRLITILAPGGTGKTRLALEVATIVKQDYLDGVFFVNLAPLVDETGFVSAVAEAVGFQLGPDQRTPQEQLIDYFRDKRVLLLLDNFEHITNAAGDVATLLDAVPHLDIIVTSRERLDLTSEQVYILPGMAVDAWSSAEQALQHSAAQLYLQTARRLSHNFDFTDDLAPTVAHICQLVGGSPLGIVLAASWEEMLTTQEIADEITRSLDFLGTTMRDVPARQRSMRAVFDYSWNLMTTSEQNTFMKLSIFRGGFTREAVQVVTGASLRDLMRLMQKSLINRQADTGRYHIHEMTRQYALDRLQSSTDYPRVAEAHSAYYIETLGNLEAMLVTRKGANHALKGSTDNEFDNTIAALKYALDTQQESRAANGFRWLDGYCMVTGNFALGLETFTKFERALHNPTSDHQSSLFWRARGFRLRMESIIGNPGEIEPLALEAVEHLTRAETHDALIYAKITLARVYMGLGDLDKALSCAVQVAELADKLDDLWGKLDAPPNIAYIEYLKGNITRAIAMQEEVIRTARNLLGPSPVLLTYAYNNMGEFQHAVGNTEAAQEYFESALNTATQINNPRMVGYALTNLGNIAHSQARMKEAIDYNQRSLDMFRDVGDRHGMAGAHVRIADALRYLDRNAESQAHLEDALRLYKSVGDNNGIGDTCTLLARLYQSQSDFKAAETYYRRGLDARRVVDNPANVVDSLLSLTLLLGSQNDISTATAYIAEAEATLAEMREDQPVLLARIESIKVYVQLVEGEYYQPYTQLPAMSETERSRQVPLWRMYMLGYWGTACFGMGKLDEAAVRYSAATYIALNSGILSQNFMGNIGLSALLSHVRGEHQRAYAYLTYLLREWKQQEFVPVMLRLINLEDIKAQLTAEQLTQAEAQSYDLDLQEVAQMLLVDFEDHV